MLHAAVFNIAVHICFLFSLKKIKKKKKIISCVSSFNVFCGLL